MWLFTRHGAFSVVLVARHDPGRPIQVRSRFRGDLLRLSRRLPGLDWGPLLQFDHADYPYRFAISRADWIRLATFLAEDVDYPNFKDAVGSEPGQREKRGLYHRIWALVDEYAPGRRRRDRDLTDPLFADEDTDPNLV